MACAAEGQRRPGLGAAADLIRGALRMRLRPRPARPAAVAAAVRLMCAGAVLETAALITINATTGQLNAALLHAYPGLTAAQWHGVLIHLTIDKAAVPAVVGLWLFLAWANNRGYDWARVAFLAFFAFNTLGVLVALGEGAAVYAPADLIAGAVIWLTGLTAAILICTGQSGSYYQREPVSPEPAQR